MIAARQIAAVHDEKLIGECTMSSTDARNGIVKLVPNQRNFRRTSYFFEISRNLDDWQQKTKRDSSWPLMTIELADIVQGIDLLASYGNKMAD